MTIVGLIFDVVLIVLLSVFIWALLSHRKEQRPPVDDGTEEAERQLEETHGNVHVMRAKDREEA